MPPTTEMTAPTSTTHFMMAKVKLVGSNRWFFQACHASRLRPVLRTPIATTASRPHCVEFSHNGTINRPQPTMK